MATKVRSYSKGARKVIANQPVVHLQFCGDSTAIEWNLIRKERGGMERVTYSQPAAHSYKCYVRNLIQHTPLWRKVKYKEWCRSNYSQIVSSDYSINVTLAVQSNFRKFQLYQRVTHWLPMFTCKSVCFCKEEVLKKRATVLKIVASFTQNQNNLIGWSTPSDLAFTKHISGFLYAHFVEKGAVSTLFDILA